MNSVLILCLTFGIAAVACLENLEDPLLVQESKMEADGKFHYHFETGKGASITQDGHLKDKEEVLEGTFSFIGEDGKVFKISYIADENGYQPQGDSIPTSPPIPPEIQRGLEYIAQHVPYVEKPNKGKA